MSRLLLIVHSTMITTISKSSLSYDTHVLRMRLLLLPERKVCFARFTFVLEPRTDSRITLHEVLFTLLVFYCYTP